MDILTLALAKKYTEETVLGGGAIKGKNCTIQSEVPIEGGTRVTFAWELDDGTKKATTLDVMDGGQGVGIASLEIIDGGRLIVTLSDGTKVDAGVVPSGYVKSISKAEIAALFEVD